MSLIEKTKHDNVQRKNSASCGDEDFVTFLLMDDITFMSLVGSRMVITHSLTHSIRINLFIKLELSNFLLPPQLSIVFVQESSVVLRKVWRGETRKAYIFVESLGKSLSSTSKIEVGHYGFHVVLCHKYVVFWLSPFPHM